MNTFNVNDQKNGVELTFDKIPPQHVRDELKTAGFRWSRAGGFWYAKNTPENMSICQKHAAESQQSDPTPVPAKYIKNEALIAEAGSIYGDVAYYKKEVFDAIRLNDGRILCFWNLPIETRFCFGEHGYDYEEVLATERASRCFDYFESENIKGLIRDLEDLDKIDGESVFAVASKNYWVPGLESLACYMVQDGQRPEVRSDQDPRVLTAEEVDKIRGVLKAQLDNMRKRCRTWWKKYGAEGLHTWTYWADA